jgi:hypothetical protein
VRRAAGRLGLPESTAQMVESEGLLSLSPRVAFWHPLVRSAVYGAAGLDERREAHRALAAATDPESDPDRKVWHRAQAAATPDEEVAAELERSADSAQARGGFAAAAAFLERAVALSPEPSRRAGRALAAAHAKFHAGALDDALELLDIAEASVADDDPIRAEVHLVRTQIAFASRRGNDATPLLAAARELETIEPRLARATYLEGVRTIFSSRGSPSRRPRDTRPERRSSSRRCVHFSRKPSCRQRRHGGSGLPAGLRWSTGTMRAGACSRPGSSSSSGARATCPRCRSSSWTGAASMRSSAS